MGRGGTPVVDTVGHHYIVEASGCDPEVISRVDRVEQILTRAAQVARVQIWAISFHRFTPTGVSGVVVISESHLSVHTWPEVGYVALDIFTCGDTAQPEEAVKYALREFGAKNVHITEVTRGLDEGDHVYFHSIVTWEEELPQPGNGSPRRKSRSRKRRGAPPANTPASP
ncbi:MAG: adenosylmethionine decarboxylase [Armatimonadota bacterium]|nr:adenosylmethionine decarboxylase [Armatimonadota bacterium]MDR7439957.1 adenosylmethionine decarboxylase [Armatimonadota bacterium]MDR7562378.1 adenosylmethionine decarboxylase [Armatimonadota bacterium]MDR7567075.1 adenosylmethionine decarboxylase [Armatimonadota bacterium]MDR7601540.1 adenosylmethionine decarboxylase [Armatimonadota bacterium]